MSGCNPTFAVPEYKNSATDRVKVDKRQAIAHDDGFPTRIALAEASVTARTNDDGRSQSFSAPGPSSKLQLTSFSSIEHSISTSSSTRADVPLLCTASSIVGDPIGL